MTLLSDVRRIFGRKRPVAIDLTGTQAEPLSKQLGANMGGGAPGSTIEPKPTRLRFTPDGRSNEEVLGLVRKIGDHLDAQTRRTEQVLRLMDRVPQALDALPEINRQNTRLMEALHEHFSQAKRREHALNDTLSMITETSGRQTDVLGLIQQQLDTSSRTTAQFGETLDELRHALGGLAESNNRSAEILANLADERTEREMVLATALARTQRWMIMAVCCCGITSLAAIAVAAVALLR